MVLLLVMFWFFLNKFLEKRQLRLRAFLEAINMFNLTRTYLCLKDFEITLVVKKYFEHHSTFHFKKKHMMVGVDPNYSAIPAILRKVLLYI